mmetsp:Transcript_33302/g.49353  ORF Transcript_33302/g.49353 Transcript_33302/m.49353 type:complete len:92 (+) Transcript_33302:268-543(+)
MAISACRFANDEEESCAVSAASTFRAIEALVGLNSTLLPTYDWLLIVFFVKTSFRANPGVDAIPDEFDAANHSQDLCENFAYVSPLAVLVV